VYGHPQNHLAQVMPSKQFVLDAVEVLMQLEHSVNLFDKESGQTAGLIYEDWTRLVEFCCSTMKEKTGFIKDIG